MKNKEIEELLNELKDVAERHTIEIREYGAVETIPQSISKELRLNSYSANLLLSYIEQLEKDKKELKDDWQQEIYDKNKVLNDWLEAQRKINVLENNRGKAIECINKNIAIYHKQLPLIAIDYEEVINILKGDSDE